MGLIRIAQPLEHGYTAERGINLLGERNYREGDSGERNGNKRGEGGGARGYNIHVQCTTATGVPLHNTTTYKLPSHLTTPSKDQEIMVPDWLITTHVT